MNTRSFRTPSANTTGIELGSETAAKKLMSQSCFLGVLGEGPCPFQAKEWPVFRVIHPPSGRSTPKSHISDP